MSVSPSVYRICVAIATICFFAAPGVISELGARDTTTTINVQVIGEDGKPVPASEAAAVPTMSPYNQIPRWQKVSESGAVTIELDGVRYPSYTVLARAAGYVMTTQIIRDPTSKTNDVVLKRGSEVRLQLKTKDNRPIPPTLKPSVFPHKWSLISCYSTASSRDRKSSEGDQAIDLFYVDTTGDGLYTTHVDPASTESLYAIVSHSGFLRSYIAGPFNPKQWATSGTVVLNLPSPAAITVRLDLGGEKPESDTVTMRLFQSQAIPGHGSMSVEVVTEEFPADSAIISADDLMPGRYSATAIMAPKQQIRSSDVRQIKGTVQVDSGESETLTLKYTPFKKEWLRGPYSAVLTLLDVQGKPAAGKPYKVTWSQTGHPKQMIAEGTVPADGKLRLENLAGIEKESTREDYAHLGGVPTFDVEVDGHNVGYIFFGEARQGKVFPPGEGKVKEYTFHIPPQPGDPAPDFSMINLETSETIRLADLKGQVVLLDFWATWCGPCQPVMAENQEIVQKNADTWKGKATILALSIDDDQETVRNHLEKRGWSHTMNAWSPPPSNDPDKTGWDSPAAELYGINSIPTVLLIDKDGIIKERGHIADVEKKIQALID